jgi:AhpD family alkylhydroperoxidase
MGKRLDDFNEFRSRMNERILGEDHASIKRFFGVDTLTYRDGALPAKTKEMLGLATSMVLRCDDCVSYHILECRKHGVTRAEFFDIFSVALTVGGSIVIPHLRRAVAFLEEVEEEERKTAV